MFKIEFMSNYEKIREISSKYNLCDSCLGRLYTKKFLGTSNKKIGKKLKNKIKYKKKITPSKCELCHGLSDEINSLTKLISNILHKYEFETFLIGCKVDEDILDFEKKIQNSLNDDDYESIKREIKRRIGKNIEDIMKKTVDFKNPDIMVKVDTSFYVVDLQVKPVYLYGRYRKIKRGIPQTKWFCRVCKGVGCKKCDFSGKLYPESVEEIISKKVLTATDGKDESFHGSGREDIDALMLGNGRPFVLEIQDPKKRDIDFQKIKKEINDFGKGKVEVNNLRFADPDEKARIKQAAFRKVYRVTFNAENSINIEKLKKAILCLQDNRIKQRTPNRVAHRRADMVREKKIYQFELKYLDGSVAILEIEAESGTYIKELVSGDDGRTQPNISDLIDNPCKVTYLDVLEIKGE